MCVTRPPGKVKDLCASCLTKSQNPVSITLAKLVALDLANADLKKHMTKNEKPVVLVADDEPSTLALVANHLRTQGYHVLEASDGDEAWNLACQELPDAVVLDVMMPGMSGWEVCRKIREAVSLAHTGVVMLTGIGDTLNEITSPLYGADAYLDKPFQFTKLTEVVKATLEQRHQGSLGRPDHTEGPHDDLSDYDDL